MGNNKKILSFPDLKEVALYGSGLIIGFYAPALFLGTLGYLAQSGIASNFVQDKMTPTGAITSGSGNNLIAGLVFVIMLAVGVYAIDKATTILRKLGWGVALGILARIALVGVLGINVPFADVALAMNATNATAVNSSISTLPG